MAGPYDIFIIGLGITGAIILGPLATDWAKEKREQFRFEAHQHRQRRELEIEQAVTGKEIREYNTRRTIAEAKAMAAIAEGQQAFIEAQVKQTVADGTFSLSNFVALAPGQVR